MYSVIKGRDQVYPWELIAPDGAPMAKFALEEDAQKIAEMLNKQEAA